MDLQITHSLREDLFQGKSWAQIVSVLGMTHRKKASGAIVLSCVFHIEKTPSLWLRGCRYICYGCGARGDMVDFVLHVVNGVSDLRSLERFFEMLPTLPSREQQELFEWAPLK